MNVLKRTKVGASALVISTMLTACGTTTTTTVMSTDSAKQTEAAVEQETIQPATDQATANEEATTMPPATAEPTQASETAEAITMIPATDQAEPTNEASTTDHLLISSQTFSKTLNPLGAITFASYAPDTSKDANADATFQIEQEGTIVQKLEGMESSDIRESMVFSEVKAVSFPDYNRDGYEDIIIICSYTKEGSNYEEVRIYQGNADGTFVLEKELSEDSKEALAELTIESVLGFLGIDRTESTIASAQ